MIRYNHEMIRYKHVLKNQCSRSNQGCLKCKKWYCSITINTIQEERFLLYLNTLILLEHAKIIVLVLYISWLYRIFRGCIVSFRDCIYISWLYRIISWFYRIFRGSSLIRHNLTPTIFHKLLNWATSLFKTFKLKTP